MKRWLLNKLLRHLFKVVTTDDFLAYKNSQLFLRDRALSNAEVQELQSQADIIRNLKLWELLNNEMIYGSQELMYKTSSNFDQVAGGKWMLYTLDVMQTKLKNLSNIK
jgi:hypothetical protein